MFSLCFYRYNIPSNRYFLHVLHHHCPKIQLGVSKRSVGAEGLQHCECFQSFGQNPLFLQSWTCPCIWQVFFFSFLNLYCIVVAGEWRESGERERERGDDMQHWAAEARTEPLHMKHTPYHLWWAPWQVFNGCRIDSNTLMTMEWAFLQTFLGLPAICCCFCLYVRCAFNIFIVG